MLLTDAPGLDPSTWSRHGSANSPKRRNGSATSAAIPKLRTRARRNCEHALVELGGIEPPSVEGRPCALRPFPRTWLNGCHSAGSDGPRGPRHRVFPPGQRSFTPSVVCPNCLHRFCCRVAVDRPRVPLPVAMTLGHLTRSGGESEIVRLGVSVGAPFKESGPLRSHVTATAIGVETDQPRGRWPSGHHVEMCKYWLSSGSGPFFRPSGYPWVVTQRLGDPTVRLQ